MDYSKVRGFNYQPSYGSTSYENWLNFNPSVVELELRRGKEYFPKFNVVRYWLSWDAYLRDTALFLESFETSLKIADRLGIKVIPCLFNRWHDKDLDNGGIYIDHILPDSSFVYRENNFDQYIRDIVTRHKDDDRILVWDVIQVLLCRLGLILYEVFIQYQALSLPIQQTQGKNYKKKQEPSKSHLVIYIS